MNLVRSVAAASTLLVAFAIAPAIARAAMQPPAAAAKFEKPTAQTVSGGQCRLDEKKTTLGAAFPGAPDAKKPYLTFSIGPATFMAQETHASMSPYHGPATYSDVLMSGNDGSSFAGLGTVKINADAKSGTFALNDGTASGTFDCGTTPR